MDHADFIEYILEEGCLPAPGLANDTGEIYRNHSRSSVVPKVNWLSPLTLVRVLKNLGVRIPDQFEDIGYVMDAFDFGRKKLNGV